jgi:hypothetical protein
MAMWRSCMIALTASAAIVSLGGCQGNGGAVSVRWRINDLSTGQTFDPMDAGSNDGFCCSNVDKAGDCLSVSVWVVRNVSIVLSDPTTDVPVPGIAARTFPCNERESTTAFDLPEGRFAIGLTAESFDGTGDPAPAIVPPPEIRTIVRGDVVNLQDIEIGVQPLPSARPVVNF